MTTNAVLTVLAPGLHTLVVDRGRPHARSLGVPLGGAADRFALAIGNALVGNPPDHAALEVSLAGPTLQASAAIACVLFGAPFDLASDRQDLRAGTTFTLEPGEVLRVGGTPRGVRAYLCVRGGIDAPIVLGSRSGLAPLQAGAQLPVPAGSSISGRSLAQLTAEALAGADGLFASGRRLLRVLPGPQLDWFGPGTLFGPEGGEPAVWRVTPASNRMGLRLQGVALPVPARELLSEPVCPGTVQVTRDGQCIILGVDGQTIGGYPKLAQVISADLDVLGQLRPGEAVAFVGVSLEQAEALHRERQAALHEWLVRLRTAEVFGP
jgi:antagonist of KipI